MQKYVYEQIPTFESDLFVIRAIDNYLDLDDLLKVYSDLKAVVYFNSDNCNGDTFYYDTKDKMKRAMDIWCHCYEKKYFVRWAIYSKQSKEVIGTIELFNRSSKDYFNNCALLRLDLRSDFETKNSIEDILNIIQPRVKILFNSDMIATKAIDKALNRIEALKNIGFVFSNEKLIGHDGTSYSYYYVKNL